MKPYYITTAIDYTNGAAAHRARLREGAGRRHGPLSAAEGDEVFFLTGVDQHGQKVQQSAEKAGRRAAGVRRWHHGQVHRAVGQARTCATTAGRDDRGRQAQARACSAMLQRLHDEGQLYKKTYKGVYYSVRQEQFLTDKERGPDGEFGPEWGEVDELEEENWYFKLSEHVEWLRGYIQSHPDFIFPAFRRDELLNAVESLAATSASPVPRRASSWGIQLPFDREFRELRLVRRAGELHQLRRLSRG